MLKFKPFIASLIIMSAVAFGAAFMLPVTARADEPEKEGQVSWDIDINDPGKVITPDIDPESTDPVDRLALEVRKHLKAFDESFTVEMTEPLDQSMDFYTISSVLKEKAVAHTGHAGEGDFLYYNLSYMGSAVNLNSGRITFFASYRMTKSQLKEFNKKEDEILKSLKIEGKNDYQKIRAIYEYMTKNTKYDYSKNKDAITYTPYAALCKHKAVCQGIAVATYDLMLKAGIDCRVITGGNHAWNIVKLEGKYYYIDATWDVGRAPSKWKYFLKGKPFKGHTFASAFKTDEFNKKYPVPKSAYKGDGKNSGHSTPAPTPTDLPSPTPTEPPLPASKTVSVYLPDTDSSLTVTAGDRVYLFMPGNKHATGYHSSDKDVFYQTPGVLGEFTALKAGRSTVQVNYTDYNKYDPVYGYPQGTTYCEITVLYRDVTNENDFWYTPTNYLTAKDVVKGYENQTLFRPSRNCTRAQMVTFIWRLMGEPEPKTTNCKFSDVKSSDYFYKACIWGNENHIVEGYKDGTFGPQIVCARKHAVTFLWRLAGQPSPKSSANKFKDVKKSDYFYTATLWASEKGILAGYSDGTFKPDGECLRRQMVTFLYKYDKYVNKKG
ncbi:MAG: S-layer homology domain-containing protein [Clostridiales bacterium]|nr:S-layer homology domain-containing protein [Clostridiales bacterium]